MNRSGLKRQQLLDLISILFCFILCSCSDSEFSESSKLKIKSNSKTALENEQDTDANCMNCENNISSEVEGDGQDLSSEISGDINLSESDFSVLFKDKYTTEFCKFDLLKRGRSKDELWSCWHQYRDEEATAETCGCFKNDGKSDVSAKELFLEVLRDGGGPNEAQKAKMLSYIAGSALSQ